METTHPIVVFWFRRDLRLNDNTGLYHALVSGFKVLPVFILDKTILNKLDADDKRVSFIIQSLEYLRSEVRIHESTIELHYDTPVNAFEKITQKYTIHAVFANHDYEPYATERDLNIRKLLASKGVLFRTFKDQVVFEKDEIVKPTGDPYTVFTPYSQQWLKNIRNNVDFLHAWNSENYLFNLLKTEHSTEFNIEEFRFNKGNNVFHPFKPDLSLLATYNETRDFPALNSTSKVSVHLRFGTVSIRQLVTTALEVNQIWLNELIWREFFMQILWHFPAVIHQPFKPKYQFIKWINNENEYNAWCKGLTGIPLVDAGMRELNETGFMHNRVRMVTAGFLVKHLLINWQWGEAYFASKLLDFELSSNNGNWQWAAGTGCDAAPYFRIFNPIVQAKKFDSQQEYIKKWIPEIGTAKYVKPIIDMNYARIRSLETYKAAL